MPKFVPKRWRTVEAVLFTPLDQMYKNVRECTAK